MTSTARWGVGFALLLVTSWALAGCEGKEKESPYVDALVVMREATKLRMAPAEFAGVVTELTLGTELLAVREDAEVSYDTTFADVQLTDGTTGFIERKYVGPPSEWQQVVDLRDSIAHAQPQATGIVESRANLRLGPGRDTRILDSIAGKTEFSMIRREGLMKGDTKEIWYLVDLGQGLVGYMFTRQLEFQHPGNLPPHVRYRRVVAWRPIGETTEHPTYVVGTIGDGDLDCDFDRVEIFAWDAGTGAYGTMFTLKDIRGILPLNVDDTTQPRNFEVREIKDDEILVTVWSDTRPAKVLETRSEPATALLH